MSVPGTRPKPAAWLALLLLPTAAHTHVPKLRKSSAIFCNQEVKQKASVCSIMARCPPCTSCAQLLAASPTPPCYVVHHRLWHSYLLSE